MDPGAEKQLKAMDHSFFKARPKGSEPFFAKRLKAMDPFYEKTQKEIDVARDLSRTSTLSGDENGFSRSSTLTIDEKGFSRSSTLNDDEKGFWKTSTLNIDERDFSRAPTLSVSERDLWRTSTIKIESPEIVKKARRGRRSWTWAVISQLIGLLWLAPIIALITLNYKNHIIGASIWCPGGNCAAELFSTQALQKAQELDNQDHNILGALQFVSKALEVWFMFISTSLVYDVAMLLAKRGGGLPVGFLLTHLEFGDIRYLLNPLLWTSPVPHPTRSPRLRAITGRLYLFVILAASLTILTNLMGPATAVLVIPSLQWIESPHIPHIKFNGTFAADPPYGDDTIPGCSEDQLDSGNYSCSSKVYGPSLDGYAEDMDSSEMQFEQDYGTFLQGISHEGSVQFSVNVTNDANVAWCPNRQSLRDLSYDALAVEYLMFHTPDEVSDDLGFSPPPMFNNSLATILQRESISLGVSTGCHFGNVTTKQVDAERGITCFGQWSTYISFMDNVNSPAIYTMCLRTGSWSDVVAQNTFYIDHSATSKHKADPKLRVMNYFSDQATYFNETTDFGSGIKSCLEADPGKKCDWDKVFATELPPEFRNATSNVQVVEYRPSRISKSATPNERVWCPSYTYLGFGVYSYDIADTNNPLAITQLKNFTDISPSERAVVFHPDWLLAAWSVEDGGTVSGDRSISKVLTKALSKMVVTSLPTVTDGGGYEEDLYYDDGDTSLPSDDSKVEFNFLHVFVMCQARSLVDWSFDTVNNTNVTARMSGPVFHNYANLHLWAYGFSDRTSMLGVVVALLGIACVIFRIALAVMFRFRHEHSAVELIVAALEHRSQGEFVGLEDEIELAKVRFEMLEDDDGRPRFVTEQRDNRFRDPFKGFT